MNNIDIQNKKFAIPLTISQLNIILKYLSNGIHNEVRDVIDYIQIKFNEEKIKLEQKLNQSPLIEEQNKED